MIEDNGSLAVLIPELERQQKTRRDLIADTRLVSFSDDDGTPLLVDLPEEGAQQFAVNGHAHGQIATHFGVGRQLYDKLHEKHPPLFTHLMNGLMSREPTKRLVRTLDGNVRAFLSNKYRPRDNFDLMFESVLPVLRDHPGRATIVKCDLTETRMYVKLALPEFERPVTPKVGDVMQGGLIIQNSEVGAGRLGVYPYTTILRCLNGVVHTDYGQSSRHVGKRIESTEEAWELYSDRTLELDDQAFFAKCADTVRAVMDETVFDAIVQQMRDLAGIKVEGAPDKVVEVFAKRHTLREGEASAMLQALIEGADLSAWGYVNSVTAMARDLDDPDRQVELQKVAGKLTSDPSWAAKALVAA